jgi:hypothetical protein
MKDGRVAEETRLCPEITFSRKSLFPFEETGFFYCQKLTKIIGGEP